MKSFGLFLLGLAVLYGGTPVKAIIGPINEAVIDLIVDMQTQFFENDLRGFQDPDTQVMSALAFTFLEGSVRRALTFDNLANDITQLPGRTQGLMDELFLDVNFNNIEGETLADAIEDEFSNVVNNLGGALDDQVDAIRLFSALVVEDAAFAHVPGVFCIDDIQCAGVREDDKFGETVRRRCNGVNTTGVIPECDTFVTFFNLRWLMTVVGLTYGVFILWALYWIVPECRKKYGGGKNQGASRKAAVEYDQQQQLIINTLATQCASAENMLFQATDMLKQAKNLQNIIAVEAKREARIMILTVEYFQCVAAILVALTHQYLDQKTFTPGEKFNLEDPATRALQLEILNYVRDRLQLAFQSDSFTEKSLYRIGEAYAVLKKITDSLVLVGFSHDLEVDESLGNLRTPFVELNENALHLEGIYKPPNGVPGTEHLNGQKVCIALQNADPRDATPMGANVYLTNAQRDSKVYDPQMQMVKAGAVGKALAYNSINSGQTGEGLQYFVRTFWGPEIAAIQQEANAWLKADGELENWLERERLEREQKAAPVVKRGPKKKRKKKKKNKKGYTDIDETATEVTEYTEASGWSVETSNDYVYNVQSVVNQGLGIAGKPGLPYDKVGDVPVPKGGKFYQWFERNFPNYAEWPKFYTIVFVIIPILIMIPMIAKVRKGSTEIDIDGNVDFKARPAGFGTSFLGVPGYYFLDGFVPEADKLVAPADPENEGDLALFQLDNIDPFGQGDNVVFISNEDAEKMFLEDFDGASGRDPDLAIGEIQAGILSQPDNEGLDGIRNQQIAQEVTTIFVYALMHTAAYFFGIIPITLVRESLEILARRFPVIRDIYPMSLWRELHMAMGLGGIFFVAAGATVFLITALVAIGKSTPFAGNAGDPFIENYFDFEANVLWLRVLLLPFVPLLLLMKYASRGPPVLMRKYAPNFITKNYWEICYFLHYVTALTAIIMLVLYRPQVFYWMGATWGFVWGGNKIVRILRTRKTTIKQANLVSYTVEDKRNNAKKRSDVLRIQLNVPASFPSSSRGQACWLTVPNIDYIAHPFTLAKVPTETDKSIMFHIAVKYLAGDDIISYARPETQSVKKPEAAPAVPEDPNALPTGWKSAVDPESGQTYYYNSLEKRTTWTRPKSNAVDKLFDGVRGITTRMSANLLRAGSARFGAVGLGNGQIGGDTARVFKLSNRATWTQRFANLANKLSTMDADLRRNAVKEYPVYVSAPLGTSMDDCLLPRLPGSIIITTQNGLPAAESSVRWLLMQGKTKRPKFHFFVSVSREVNDALSVVETLRDAMCESVVAGHLNMDGVSGRHAHMADWLGVYIHLTRRKPSQIAGDREMLMKSLSPPAAPVTPRQLELINDFIKNRVNPGRLPFDRFLARTQQMVFKRTGVDNMAVGYCGSAKVAYSIRSACRALKHVKFDGEYI